MNTLAAVTQLLEIVFAILAAPVFLGWVNQCRAWLQNRSAPSLLQPYRGIHKLFHKEAVIAENAAAKKPREKTQVPTLPASGSNTEES